MRRKKFGLTTAMVVRLERAIVARHGAAKGLERGEVFERSAGLIADIDVVHVGEREVFDVAFEHIAAGDDEAGWVAVGELAEEDGVGDTENRGRGADSERNGDDGRLR
jgi:hypothetical protein